MRFLTIARLFAACIAATAWTGLAVQIYSSWHAAGSMLHALWIILGFFTILSNLAVGVVFTCVAIDRGKALTSNSVIAGTMLSILLVGVVNALLLWGALELSGGSALVDKLLHVTTPALVPIFWILFVRKGSLTRKDPLLWAIYPFAYFIYAIARGLATGRYAYPFLNVAMLGWQRTSLNALVMAIAFMASGYAVVWLDNVLARR